MNTQERYDKDNFKSLNVVRTPEWIKVFTILLCAFFVFFSLILTVTPWWQTSQGAGYAIAYNPNDRIQNINSVVPGLIDKWFVRDGSKVKKGDPIVQIVDNDPRLIERLELERDAIQKKYQVAKIASETALLNYKRQEELFKQGLSARTKLEKAKIDYKKLLASEAKAAADLAKAEVSLSRQRNQLILAPRDGTILRVMAGSGSVFVKKGDILATFVPTTVEQAVELYVSGNDLPLIYPGRKVRLQFEGWPAIQISGWPSVAIGTFGGIVKTIDPSTSKNGKFRVLVARDENEVWPSNEFLRQGSRVYGWIVLNKVKLGFELWRQFNNFPIALTGPPDNLLDIKKAYEKAQLNFQKSYDDDDEEDKKK